METMNKNSGQIILAIGLIIATIIGGIFYATNRETGKNTLTVTGSARMSVVADNVIWRTSFTRNVEGSLLKTGYADMARDLAVVKQFILKQGIADTSVTVSPIMVNEDWQNNPGSAPKRYTLRQNIEINSSDVQKITDIAKQITDVVNAGVFYQTDGLEYYYSGLNDARVTLLTDAITDARLRAESMAKSGNQRVGKLASATSGVVQVLSKGSVDISDYGSYDTSKIDKDIMVTVRATFQIK